ncbi:phosphopentomutase [Roseococcus sp. SYP-B2431]|uniref:phosphopentomutase n=1 Tax=Roseococcus sp. SYP-B2431 TaxID=2496640 RepID=UPI00103C8411|nr:phosphopentomutase [Roseococcus sp. SYP-B2431]TCH98113.1 phosphopentomutase [Roseococcus sp. SYP-B2431]
MTRCLLIVLDSLGVGAAPDAADYGDEGADTLGHIIARTGLRLPALHSLGLGRILGEEGGEEGGAAPLASYGRMRERSPGKDSTTGHWEIAGAVLEEPFAVFEHFPAGLMEAIEEETGLRFLGNHPASGTAIIEGLGEEHMRTGRPILYTSADSVLQIAAHEEVIGVERLYAVCAAARRHADAWRIGRVIARPFTGRPGSFTRTERRHDFSMRPPRTVLDAISEAGIAVRAVGKIADLFAGQGITETHPTGSNAQGMQATEELWRRNEAGLVFTNLVDFDTLYGHRRDVAGYAVALAEFDAWLAGLLPRCRPEDLVIITADHGNDPTYRGTDHTREEVPLLVLHGGRAGPLGTRDGFADIAASLAVAFGLPPWPRGRPFL